MGHCVCHDCLHSETKGMKTECKTAKDVLPLHLQSHGSSDWRGRKAHFPQRFSDCGPFCLPPPYDCQEARRWKQRRKMGNSPVLSRVRDPLFCCLRWNLKKGFADFLPLSTSWWSLLDVSGCLEPRLGHFGRKYGETHQWFGDVLSLALLPHSAIIMYFSESSNSCSTYSVQVLELHSGERTRGVYLSHLTWDQRPSVLFFKHRIWSDILHKLHKSWNNSYCLA